MTQRTSSPPASSVEAASVSDAIPVVDALARPLRDLRISVTDRCNFRCPYCMPAEVFGERYAFLPKPEILSFEEIERLARVFVEQGVRKLRITGGEPLLRVELPRLIERLARIPGVEDLALTTNGVLLAQHAKSLRSAGLRRVTVSLDSLDDATFKQLNGRGVTVDKVLAGLEAAEAAGLAPLKINTVVVKGVNDHQVVELARYFRGSGHVLRLIEFMDVGTRNEWERARVVPAQQLVERIHAHFPLEPLEPLHPGEVAERYRYVDGQGEIGVIASVTRPFCGGCTRARLSADGQLFLCLFGRHGYDLKAPLRAGESDAELYERIRRVWGSRRDRYSEERSRGSVSTDLERASSSPRVEMNRVGG